MSKISKILKTIFVLVGISFFFSLERETADAYSCPAGYYCSQIGGITDGEWNRKRGWCSSAYTTYSCGGTEQNCSGGYDTYDTYADCLANDPYGYAGCCNYGEPPVECEDCTPPACPAGTAESPNTGYSTTTSCSRGDDCSPANVTRTCYYQRQAYCTSTTTSKRYLKAGESATITSISNTPVNYFTYAFYNRDNGNAAICSYSYIAGWATYQGSCPAGTYILSTYHEYPTAQTTDVITFPAANMFIADANWGGQVVKSIQVNGYFMLYNRPISLPEVPCVFYQDYCSPLCSPTSCVGPTYSTTNYGLGSKVYTCNNTPAGCGSESRTCYCTGACTAPNCPTDLSNTNLGFGTSTVTTNCVNDCSVTTTRSCYCKDCVLPVPAGTTLTNTGKQSTDPLYQSTQCSRGTGCPAKVGALYCTRCTPAACAPTYSTANQGFGTKILSCNNTLTSCGTENRTCYCYACTPPACAPTYSTTNYGYGSVTLSCTNNCTVTTNRTCYIDQCSNCTLPNCPSPLTNTPTTTDPNMDLANFRTCTRSVPCGGPANFGSCYEQVSPQPTTGLQIFPDGVNEYGFSSSTHTGNRATTYNLNDPIRMTATYTDVNGATDIEAVSVWFRDSVSAGEIASPLWIDTSVNPGQPPRTSTNRNWGFMMRWEGSSWVPYVPSIPAFGDAQWVRAVYSNNSFVISGPGGLQMVRVTIGHNLQSNITRSGNNVVLPFQLSFTFTSGYENVAQVEYDTFLMGNDIFSFTPNDNYNFSVDSYWQSGQLRYRTSPTPSQLYARQWAYSGYKWNIDKGAPEVETLTMSVVGDTTLRLSWQISDTRAIYGIVGNIYASISMPPSPPPITISGVGLEIAPQPYALSLDDSNMSKLNQGYAFRKTNIGGTSSSGEVTINIGENKEGSLIIYLTVYDLAGNMNVRSLTYSLGDWIITEGGLAYSSDGMDYEIKNIESESKSLDPFEETDPIILDVLGETSEVKGMESGGAWDGVLALAGMDPSKADVSTELFADNNLATLPSAPAKSSLNKSYHMRPFTMNTEISAWYDELKKAYNDREIEGKVDLTNDLPAITSLNGSLNTIGSCRDSSSVCILKHQGNLDVGNTSKFICDNWGVFFVDGDLTIHREIENTLKSKDACIFVVSGNVTIKEGDKKSSAALIQYDQINAYIVADGTVTIDAELGLSPKYDGMFVGGGIHSMKGLNMNRSLKLVDRNTFPALVVRYHSKYSVLSNLVFGSQIDILKTELGFKPY